MAIDAELALRRIGQIEQRILSKHPKAARDGELASMLSSLRDALAEEPEAECVDGAPAEFAVHWNAMLERERETSELSGDLCPER